MFNAGINIDIGIDLGTCSTIIYASNKGVVLEEPSVVATDAVSGEVVAAGTDALVMLGRTHNGLNVIYPLEHGVISDFNLTEKMIRLFLTKAMGAKLFKPTVVVCLPGNVTHIEQRAVIDAIMFAGAKRVFPIEESVAAAIGAGMDISIPHGCMVVDVGGGTTDIAVISLSGISVSESVKKAGISFDEDIIKYVRSKFKILIGRRMAEQIKLTVGCVFPLENNLTMEAKGRNLRTGLPQKFTITSFHVLEAVSDTAADILSSVQRVLEKTPPELIGDVLTDGIILTGGGCLIRGMAEMLQKGTGVNVKVSDNAQKCVSIGTGESLKYINLLSDSVYSYRTLIAPSNVYRI